MSEERKALMTHYVDGSLITAELRQMFNDEASDARFESELPDDVWQGVRWVRNVGEKQ